MQSVWPSQLLLPANGPVICPYHLCSLGGTAGITVPTSSTYPAANRAIYIPLKITRPYIAKILWWLNGATASGNIDVGIYSNQGARIISTGSTAQAGTNVIQIVDIADTLLAPGLYYMAVAMDNTTGTLFRGTTSSALVSAIVGLLLQASAFPLPAIATFATHGATSGTVPLVGLAERTFV